MCGLLRYEILTTMQSKQKFPLKITDSGKQIAPKYNTKTM